MRRAFRPLRSRFALPALLLPLAVLAASAPGSAAVVWTANFENGDLSEWKPGVNEKKGDRVNAEASSEKPYRGMYSGKITVHPDDTFTFDQNRVDIQHPSTLTDEGKDMWLSGHYMMPDDAKVRNEIGFFESNVSYQNVMDFWVEPKAGGGTTINFGVGFLGENKLWTAEFTKGVWHQLAIHVHWSTNAQQGSVDIWLDGVQTVTAAKAKTKADGNTLFFQTGLHRKDVGQFTETLYFDDFIEADSFADAKIMSPSSAPSMGGAGGAAGAGPGGAAGAAGTGSSSSSGGGGASGSSSAGMGGAAGSGSTMGGTPSSVAGASSAGTAGTAVPSASNADDSSGCSIRASDARQGEGNSLAVLIALLGVTVLRRRPRTE